MTAQPPEPPVWAQQPQYNQQQYPPPQYWPGYSPPNRDKEHLKLLSVFHYVLGGLTGLMGCMPFMHVAMGVAIITGKLSSPDGDGLPLLFGWIFVIMGAIAIIGFWTVAILFLVAAGRLKKRRSWTFCFVVACVSCLIVPHGTVLGVFTIIVLIRDSVKASFAKAQAG